ncbi:MAG: type II toxin-antitoxin system RelE/ParE family toxin [Acidobacteriota bacterium]|nr:type II toxin-antitoxin system RelE/ParE family toxin [Acidobacteriota bacterium]
MRVKWLRAALRDLSAELEYIAQDSPAAAARSAIKIRTAVALLGSHPALGRPGRVIGTRELVVDGTLYLVPYRVRGDHVELLRIFRGARRWPSDL